MKPNNFHYRMIKARVAETIIKELFQVCGYKVFEHGMERSMPVITGQINRDDSDVALQIRKMPEFVVQAPPPDSCLNYLEVKYRKNGRFPSKSDNIENYPYKNAWFIVVSKTEFRCISYQQIMEGEKINGNDDFLLENSQVFKLDKSLVQLYLDYSKSFFEGVE